MNSSSTSTAVTIPQEVAANEYVVAARNPHYTECGQKSRLKELAAHIGEAFRFRGQQAAPADLADMAVNLDRKVAQDFPHITLQEIRLAFEYGVTGEYGEYFGINFVTLFKFIKAYSESQDRADAIRRYREAQKAAAAAPKALPAPTEDQIRDKARSDLEDYFNQIRSKGFISASYHSREWMYNYLRKLSVMPKPSEGDVSAAMRSAELWLESYSKSTVRSFFELIDDSRDSQDGTTDAQKIRRKAKAALLEKFLKASKNCPEIP